MPAMTTEALIIILSLREGHGRELQRSRDRRDNEDSFRFHISLSQNPCTPQSCAPVARA
jgi:hypothetical protein